MATSIVFNSCQVNLNNKYTQLLALISIHPAFKAKVNDFYQILNLNPTSDSLLRLGSLYFALFLPDYPSKHIKLLAQEVL
jgi:hypothetical protein